MFLPGARLLGSKEGAGGDHKGTGKPWLCQSVAAVELKAPFRGGYSIKKTVTPVEQANKSLPAGQYTRGDVLRVKLEVNASADMTWVAITDRSRAAPPSWAAAWAATRKSPRRAKSKAAAAGPRLKAQLLVLPQLLPVPAQGHRDHGIHRAPGQCGRLRLAAQPVEALYAPDVW